MTITWFRMEKVLQCWTASGEEIDVMAQEGPMKVSQGMTTLMQFKPQVHTPNPQHFLACFACMALTQRCVLQCTTRVMCMWSHSQAILPWAQWLCSVTGRGSVVQAALNL
jgi:hypothetical protein